ncbi:MAG: 30S ribosome-binding factor RbfA [Coriobacteriales bacterium]|nr:30S ribosome-binding factor RbfA [Coriobacteriales bacterium]
MKQTPQTRKLNEAVREALASILLLQVSDPRLALITVTGAEVSKDRSVANVYIAADGAHYDEVMAGLQSAKGRLRSLLGQQLNWRVTPELRFYLDTSVDEAARISDALAAVPPTLVVEKDAEGYPVDSAMGEKDAEGYPVGDSADNPAGEAPQA